MRGLVLCSAAAHVAAAPSVDSNALAAKWAAEDDARWRGRREMSLAAALEGNLHANRQPLKVWNTCPCVTPSYCHFPEGASQCPHTGTCHGTGVLCDCNDCYRNDKGANNTVCTDCPAPTPPPTQPIPPTPTPGAFEIWADPPGSELYEKYSPQWYNHIYVRATLTLDFIAEESAHFTANSSTSTYRGTPNGVGDDGNVFVDVAMGEHGAIHLFADPGFQQIYDNRVRALSNASAAMNFTGVLDRCGWPLPHGQGAAGTKGAGAPCTTHPCTNKEFARSSEVFHDDFSRGLDPAKWTVALLKGCCERTTDANMFQRNIYSTWDTEGTGIMGGGSEGLEGATDTDGKGGASFPVLALRAHANDDDTGEGKSCCNGTDCPGKTCHKIVTHSGTIASAGLYASGRYDVVAKVPASSGLIWAVWTYHYEEHFPSDCTKGQCWCDAMPNEQSVWTEAQCEPGQWSDGPGEPVTKHGCKTRNLCGPSSDGWTTIPTPSPTGEYNMFSPGQCGMRHSVQHGDPSTSWIGDDPQFLGEGEFLVCHHPPTYQCSLT